MKSTKQNRSSSRSRRQSTQIAITKSRRDVDVELNEQRDEHPNVTRTRNVETESRTEPSNVNNSRQQMRQLNEPDPRRPTREYQNQTSRTSQMTNARCEGNRESPKYDLWNIG